ncbi:MAG: amino acid permease [Thermodesulfobacteriota bacterium]|nr:amino acid permease [Thermodesulfobacteriota bacterium]
MYIYALPVKEMKGVLEVGAKSATFLFGSRVSKYFSGAIALCILSVLSAMIMVGLRVYYAMAKDDVFFKLFSKVHTDRGTPVYSIFLQAALAIIMVLTASFDMLLLYVGFTLSLFATLTVLGMMLLRFKRSTVLRTYRTFGYPITPIFFILGNLWIVYFSLMSRPATSLFGLGTIGLGIVAYLYFYIKR